MARRKKKVAVKEFLLGDLKDRVRSLMENRRRLLHPFPVDAMAVYRSAWTTREYEAISMLARSHGEKMFRRSRIMLIRGFELDAKRYRIIMKLPEDMPTNEYYNTIIAWSNLPIEFAHPIAEWLPHWLQHKEELDKLLNKIEEVAAVCQTYGQVYRLWPDILGFFDERGRATIDAARTQSKYPDGVWQWEKTDTLQWEKRGLKEEFKPEAFAPFNAVIAECLMLPKIEGEEIGSVELIS